MLVAPSQDSEAFRETRINYVLWTGNTAIGND
jgi:hypothetical protein